MKYKNIIHTIENNVLTIVINRPSKLNALNSEILDELEKIFNWAYEDSDIRAIIITGAGEKAFVAGADITEFTLLNRIDAKIFSEKGQEIFKKIAQCPKAVIAAINGFALGGGLELAMACHLRIATEKAKFGQPEVGLGLIPGFGGTQRLTELVGKGKAFELILSGNKIDSIEAQKIGLVNYVVSDNDLLKKCKEIAQIILSKSPGAISEAIRCIHAYTPSTNGYEIESSAFANCCETEDFKEGVQAFIEKRKAHFKGK